MGLYEELATVEQAKKRLFIVPWGHDYHTSSCFVVVARTAEEAVRKARKTWKAMNVGYGPDDYSPFAKEPSFDKIRECMSTDVYVDFGANC